MGGTYAATSKQKAINTKTTAATNRGLLAEITYSMDIKHPIIAKNAADSMNALLRLPIRGGTLSGADCATPSGMIPNITPAATNNG